MLRGQLHTPFQLDKPISERGYNCDVHQNATIETHIFYENLYLKINYRDIGTVVTLCKRLGGKVLDTKYDPDPIIEVQVRQSTLETFHSQLQSYGIGV